MDKNTIVGLSLIFMLYIAWQWMVSPSPEQMAEYNRVQDSLALVAERDSLAKLENVEPVVEEEITVVKEESDSAKTERMSGSFGPFASAATGQEQETSIENEFFKITFTNKGGRIKQIELKDYYKVTEDAEGNQSKSNLLLLEDEKNKFEYFLPIANLPSGGVNTGDLYFSVSKSGQSISFKADAGSGRYFEQKYTIQPESYEIDYAVNFQGLNTVIAQSTDEISLKWVNYLDRLEINTKYEQNYTSTYFKPVDDDDPDNCSCTSDDKEDYDGKAIEWVSHSNQFFNTTFIGEKPFNSAVMEIQMLDKEDMDLKKMQTEFKLPYERGNSESINMTIYSGPNEFDRLYAMENGMEDIIPFGTSIFGTINRWIIRPLFKFLSGFIGSAGIVILLLTLIVKLLLYPLTYKMLYSQSKMGALKPRIEQMKEKIKDAQEQQRESMKLYSEFGVNPLGGCMPMVLQMPIWFALYRFFPAAIEFRQSSFLWANDLSSYDVIMRLPFEVPLGFGAHISLFTILWAISSLIYTYYNTKHMDMSANPAMKYMQYLMPIMFLGFFNSFASGLTCYLFFSTLLNISQTLITKNYIIDKEKINKELEAYRKKPKKKGGFQQRLQDAMQEQQKLKEQRDQQKNKKKQKRK